MKARLLAGLAAAAFLLALNHFEPDVYENGSPEPPPPGSNVEADDPLLERALPRELRHECPDCGPCIHPLILLENRRTMSLVDHDGWYRLFWAGDDRYWYDDPVWLAQGLSRRTAGEAEGSWRIRAKAGPARHAGGRKHACGAVAEEIEVDYALVVGADSGTADEDEVGGVRIATFLPWLLQRVDTEAGPRTLSLGWKRAGPAKAASGPCACSR
jgi:hypothetical protein